MTGHLEDSVFEFDPQDKLIKTGTLLIDIVNLIPTLVIINSNIENFVNRKYGNFLYVLELAYNMFWLKLSIIRHANSH